MPLKVLASVLILVFGFRIFPGCLTGIFHLKIAKLISFVLKISSYFPCSYLYSWYYHSPRHSGLKPQSSKHFIFPHFSQIFSLQIPLCKICQHRLNLPLNFYLNSNYSRSNPNWTVLAYYINTPTVFVTSEE